MEVRKVRLMVVGLSPLGDHNENTPGLENTFDDGVSVSMFDGVDPPSHGNGSFVNIVDFCASNDSHGSTDTCSGNRVSCLLCRNAGIYHYGPICRLEFRAS